MVGGPDFSNAVESPTDTALRESDIEYNHFSGTVASAGDEVVTNTGNGSGTTNYILNASGVITSGNGDVVTENVYMHIEVFDSDVNTINELYIPFTTGGKFFPHGFPVPDGGTIKANVYNESSESIDVITTIAYRTS